MSGMLGSHLTACFFLHQVHFIHALHSCITFMQEQHVAIGQSNVALHILTVCSGKCLQQD